MTPSLPHTPAGSRAWRIVHFPLATLLIGLAMLFTAGQLAHLLTSRTIGDDPTPLLRLLGTVIDVIVLVAAYRLFNRFVERRPNVEFALTDAPRELGAGLLAGFLLFSSVVGVIALLGGYHVLGTNPLAVLVPYVTLSLSSGVIEELVTRGLIFRLLEQWLGSWAALAISAALFGAAHLANPNATLFSGLAIAVEAGIMLAALYMLTRRLWASIGLHAAWNFTQGGIYGIPVSGFAAPGLLRLTSTGTAALTGGAFGAEASVPALVLATAFGIAVLAAAAKHDRVVPWLPRRGTRVSRE